MGGGRRLRAAGSGVPDAEKEEDGGGENMEEYLNSGESRDWRRAGRQGYCEETTRGNHARETRGRARETQERKNSIMVLSLFLQHTFS
jgi:hypothetical protein